MHNNRVSVKQLAKELGWNEKYLSTVLNRENPSKGAEEKVKAALNRILDARAAVAG